MTDKREDKVKVMVVDSKKGELGDTANEIQKRGCEVYYLQEIYRAVEAGVFSENTPKYFLINENVIGSFKDKEEREKLGLKYINLDKSYKFPWKLKGDGIALGYEIKEKLGPAAVIFLMSSRSRKKIIENMTKNVSHENFKKVTKEVNKFNKTFKKVLNKKNHAGWLKKWLNSLEKEKK